MSHAPPTRHSLILRLRNRQDAGAWRDFAAIYEPVIYRVARRRGCQHADAQELVQRVFLAVSGAIDRFQPDARQAKFRTWLYRITHNEFCKAMAQNDRHAASGDTAARALLDDIAAPDDFDLEYRRQIFRWAAERVQPLVQVSTWQAFWQTSVEGIPSQTVADALGLSLGAVYIARSRVMKRLQREVAKYEEQP